MTYVGLAGAFPYYIEVNADKVMHVASLLSESRSGAPNGSSFAVTSDGPRGKRRVWLSEVSFQTMIGTGAIPDVFNAMETKTGE